MKSVSLEEEKITSYTMVLNPNSGEWIKGINIVITEIGLVSFNGKVPWADDIFDGIGNKANRRRYIVNRLAFVRVYFSILNIMEVGKVFRTYWK